MMNTNNLYGLMNVPAFDALQSMREQFNNSALAITMRELQRTIDAVNVPMSGITAALQIYQDSIAPLTATIQHINALYTPILEQTKKYESLYNNAMESALQSSAVAMKAMAGLDLSAIQNIANSLPTYDFLSNNMIQSINFDIVAELYDKGKITDEDIAEEFNEMVAKKDFSFVETWDKVKKARWFLAIRWVFVILMFFGSTVIDKAKNDALEALGVNEFWEKSGVYEWLDEIFDVDDDSTVSEEEIGNISK